MTRLDLVIKEAKEARAHAWSMMVIANDAAHFLPEGDPRRTLMLFVGADAGGMVEMLDDRIKLLSGASAPLFQSRRNDDMDHETASEERVQ
jgi:hypothetical protein